MKSQRSISKKERVSIIPARKTLHEIAAAMGDRAEQVVTGELKVENARAYLGLMKAGPMREFDHLIQLARLHPAIRPQLPALLGLTPNSELQIAKA